MKIFFKNWVPRIIFFIGVTLLVLSYGPILKDEIWYQYTQVVNKEITLSNNEEVPQDLFSRYLTSRPLRIQPVNKDFSLVIEKIGVNAPVVKDVSVTDEESYNAALKRGIAHAASSYYPSEEPGTVYLFAHSSTNFWQLGRYANVFNLLRKVEVGERVHVFYDEKHFVYEIQNVEVFSGFNTYPLTRPTLEPTLVIQTCDPPGTTINRLVVTSTLIEVI
jgi:LPXTG-site transpeptidase (sortase) family protein